MEQVDLFDDLRILATLEAHLLFLAAALLCQLVVLQRGLLLGPGSWLLLRCLDDLIFGSFILIIGRYCNKILNYQCSWEWEYGF